MPSIRNSEILRRFNRFFRLKTNDFLGSEAGRMLVPVITEPIPKNIIQISDVTLNDSDKTFTVPSGKQWRLLYGAVTLVSTATMGNRQVGIRFEDADGNIVWRFLANATQAASLTEHYILNPNADDVSEATGNRHVLPIPRESWLPENFRVHILDTIVVDAAADDLTIRFVVEEIEVTGE